MCCRRAPDLTNRTCFSQAIDHTSTTKKPSIYRELKSPSTSEIMSSLSTSARMAPSLQRSALRSTASASVRSSRSISTRAQTISRCTPTLLRSRYHTSHPHLRKNGAYGSIRLPSSAAYTTSTSSHGRELTADDYIQELQDLYGKQPNSTKLVRQS